MRHLKFNYPQLSIKELLETYHYYNISAQLLACQGDFAPLIEIYGEREAFVLCRKIVSLKHECLNKQHKYGMLMILNQDSQIVDWHWHISAMIAAGTKMVYFTKCNEAAPDYGVSWINKYQCANKVINFYEKISTIWNLS